ncbi:UNVERIFIED_CONTAM: hypothetical protein Sangu_1178800 [Sesamum angustifolium]|uniref:Uncharacterized protein n=1 Tax=Sesamum angustifolium TaxID=2727405 RepID=A0AAW2NH68_9LAMI
MAGTGAARRQDPARAGKGARPRRNPASFLVPSRVARTDTLVPAVKLGPTPELRPRPARGQVEKSAPSPTEVR